MRPPERNHGGGHTAVRLGIRFRDSGGNGLNFGSCLPDVHSGFQPDQHVQEPGIPVVGSPGIQAARFEDHAEWDPDVKCQSPHSAAEVRGRDSNDGELMPIHALCFPYHVRVSTEMAVPKAITDHR